MWTIVLLLLVMWTFGMLTSNTLGGLIHILLVFAIISVAIRLIKGRRLV